MIKNILNWFSFGLVGISTGLSFHLVNKILSLDNTFDLWELFISFSIPIILAIFISRILKKNIILMILVSILTIFIPVLGPSFGGTGEEPIWLFGLLGLIGGLFWAFPIFIIGIFRKSK